MKNIILVIFLSIGLYYYNHMGEEILIPDEAIRFRVIASTNSATDQEIKLKVRDDLEKEVISDINKSTNLNETRNTLRNNIPRYENIITNTLEKNDIKQSFTINYGMNYFPEKKYKGVKYKEGKYESLVVTLGKGEGNNWWCCLFPPLCLLEAEETEKDEVEYKFFVKELIDKYLK